jgi:opacity protein-like surface antigen
MPRRCSPGLSHDAILLSYATDQFSSRPGRRRFAEGLDELYSEGDTDHYGIYASYTGIEDVTIDAYWIYVMDDHGLLANADVDLHTIGLRGNGKINAFDFEAEVAYQFGDAEIDGAGGDIDAGNLGANVEVGYTFDATIQPRLYLGGAYLGGDADADELSFNRLFSNWEYSEFIENTELSNTWLLRAGVSIMPTESVKLALAVTYFQVDDTVDTPGFLFFDGDDGDDDLGWEVGLYGSYQYSEDLAFRAGYAHYFGDDGLEGELVALNGNAAFLGDEDDDYDYLFVETEIKF